MGSGTRPVQTKIIIKPEAAGSVAGTTKKTFFSNGIVEAWNMVPDVIKKRAKTVSSCKNAYRRHREDMVANA